MKVIEASGRTLEEAVQAAARELGVSVDGVEYEIVEEGAKRFLGLGQIPTTIKAHVKEGYVPGSEPAPAQIISEDLDDVHIEDIVEEEPIAANGDAFVDSALKIVGDIVKAMGIDAKVELKSADPEEINMDIVGADVAILIGRQGQTLDALQYLVGLIMNRGNESRRRVILDAQHYRARHQEMIEQKAQEYADAVRAEGKEAVLEPQSARDRRIVHMSLADDLDVYTYSEGMGDDRHVVISPRK
ncbi:MAG: Jag N-terminal domain-containing protein [Armatimonadetes bacterium]|nr:Jag N-terminal domain-containing protein [Armatimonadota bacterium]